MRNIRKDIKFTKYVLFFGRNARKWVRFCASMYSMRLKVLLYDASFTREVFLSSVGSRLNETLIRFRDKDYTTDLEYMLNEGNAYDIVVIFDDFSQPQMYNSYYESIDFGYFCCDAGLYAMDILEQFMERYALNTHYPFAFVFEGSKAEAEEWDVIEQWKYMETRRRKANRIIYIPRNEQDEEGYRHLEYGRYDYCALSDGLRELLDDAVSIYGGVYLTSAKTAAPVIGI